MMRESFKHKLSNTQGEPEHLQLLKKPTAADGDWFWEIWPSEFEQTRYASDYLNILLPYGMSRQS